MDNQVKTTAMVCATILMLVGGVVSCTVYESRIIAKAVEAGADPIATRCAISPGSTDRTMCAVVAMNKGKQP